MTTLLVVSVGCPSGIGPEVSVVAASRTKGRILLVGDEGAIRLAADRSGVAARQLLRVKDPHAAKELRGGQIGIWQPGNDLRARDRLPGKPTAVSGAAQLLWIDCATDLVRSGEGDALVTGPVSKEAIARSNAPAGKRFLGHTEHLQRRLGAREVTMAFWSTSLVTALVTTHLPLARVAKAIRAEDVARASFWLGHFLASISRKKPKIAVASLNPHAGEGGLLGSEEESAIRPGVARAVARLKKEKVGASLVGPIGAETAFRRALAGDFDGVVAMYHDQATIPMKLVAFGDAVNVSLGLPIIRTSVDHGTGYDRAARYDADATGMIEAMALAQRLVAAQTRRQLRRRKA